MRAVVTGAAGFIGSTLCDALLAAGEVVIAVDSFTPYYDRSVKERNSRGFALTDVDLCTADLAPIVRDADVVFHLAAQPGVRASWSDGFDACERHNVLATQRLLEAVASSGVPRLVFASSSSVYGAAPGTVDEDSPLRPRSPYGVTKLAGEALCAAYAAERDVHVVMLRLFTVYGPRQRPDMAIHRLIESAFGGEAFPLYGDGTQRRDFTFVDDVVRAALRAATADAESGAIFNIAGGASVELSELVDAVARAVGRPPRLESRERQPGDVPATAAQTKRAESVLGWQPAVTLDEGIQAQARWHRRRSGM